MGISLPVGRRGPRRRDIEVRAIRHERDILGLPPYWRRPRSLTGHALSGRTRSRILGGVMLDSVLRRLARAHWVRLHGTPRVTVLVGGARAREVWTQWLALADMAGTLLEGDFDSRIREAVARALAEPSRPIAVLVTADAASRWRADRR